MYDFILEVTLRWFDLNDLIETFLEVCYTGIAVDVGFDCLKDLTVPADLKGRARERFPAFLVVLVDLDAGQRSILKSQGDVTGVVPRIVNSPRASVVKVFL